MRAGAIALAALAFVYAVACVDVTLRARSAYLEGEKYMSWAREPGLKRAALQTEFETRARALRDDAAAGKISAAEAAQREALLRFELNERMQESSLKYAYVWYRTAARLLTPPESRWVVMSREKMGEAKQLWKAELEAQKVPYKDYMLE